MSVRSGPGWSEKAAWSRIAVVGNLSGNFAGSDKKEPDFHQAGKIYGNPGLYGGEVIELLKGQFHILVAVVVVNVLAQVMHADEINDANSAVQLVMVTEV